MRLLSTPLSTGDYYLTSLYTRMLKLQKKLSINLLLSTPQPVITILHLYIRVC